MSWNFIFEGLKREQSRLSHGAKAVMELQKAQNRGRSCVCRCTLGGSTACDNGLGIRFHRTTSAEQRPRQFDVQGLSGSSV
jgi:hypothetical protein